MNHLLQAALDCQARGWSVIPLVPRGKTPNGPVLPKRYEQGFMKATWEQFQRIPASKDRIRDWWALAPSSNVGICTGAASGFFALDCDTALASSVVRNKGIPNLTPTVRTGRGFHFYFAMPDFPVGNRSGLMNDVDIRGTGGYIVAPPSVHPSGNEYEWTGFIYLQPAPEWLLDLLRPQHTAQYESPADRPLQIKHGDRYARAAFNGEYLMVLNAPVGNRDDTLNRACYNLGQLVGDGLLDRTEVENAMLSAAVAIGLNERETRATIASGVGDGIANPRSNRPHIRSYSRG
jgi:hypothetical protein